MNNLNPIYLAKPIRIDTSPYNPINVNGTVGVHGRVNSNVHGSVDSNIDLTDRSAMIVGGALGGVAGNFLSRTLLKNVSDLKKLIASTNNAKECIDILQGYDGSSTPISYIADKCISICNKYPQSYKGKCLKLLNNYNALGTIIGTAGGTVLGGALSQTIY